MFAGVRPRKGGAPNLLLKEGAAWGEMDSRKGWRKPNIPLPGQER